MTRQRIDAELCRRWCAFKQPRDGRDNTIFCDAQWQNATCFFTLSQFSSCSPVSEVAPSLENLAALSRLTKINARLTKGTSLTQHRYANLWQSETSKERY